MVGDGGRLYSLNRAAGMAVGSAAPPPPPPRCRAALAPSPLPPVPLPPLPLLLLPLPPLLHALPRTHGEEDGGLVGASCQVAAQEDGVAGLRQERTGPG